jgi:hypothetical protein
LPTRNRITSKQNNLLVNYYLLVLFLINFFYKLRSLHRLFSSSFQLQTLPDHKNSKERKGCAKSYKNNTTNNFFFSLKMKEKKGSSKASCLGLFSEAKSSNLDTCKEEQDNNYYKIQNHEQEVVHADDYDGNSIDNNINTPFQSIENGTIKKIKKKSSSETCKKNYFRMSLHFFPLRRSFGRQKSSESKENYPIFLKEGINKYEKVKINKKSLSDRTRKKESVRLHVIFNEEHYVQHFPLQARIQDITNFCISNYEIKEAPKNGMNSEDYNYVAHVDGRPLPADGYIRHALKKDDIIIVGGYRIK